MVAALYVERGGPYFSMPDVDPWDVERDARLYGGPHPVRRAAPCGGAPAVRALVQACRILRGARLRQARRRRWVLRGGDCSGETVGGVLEHPAVSSAWAAFGLRLPRRAGGWMRADDLGGWTCHVDQSHYGHLSIKQTWLYAHGVDLPWLTLGVAPNGRKLVSALPGDSEKRRRAIRTGQLQRLSHMQRIATPAPFRDLLLSMARTAIRPSLALEAG